MSPEDALAWLDATLAEFPQKVSDHEIQESMRWQVTNIVRDNRQALVGALKLWLGRRTLPSLPLDLAVHHHLSELRPCLEAVLDAIERGDGYPAYYREFLPAFRRRLEQL